MKAKAGVLTNFEVLEFLRSRGITSDPLGSLGAVSQSECKVYDYLVKSAACNQTREHINAFMSRCGKFKLAKAEKLNIINLRPSSQAEIDPVIEYIDQRLVKNEEEGINEVQELVDLIVEVFPEPPMDPQLAEEDVQS